MRKPSIYDEPIRTPHTWHDKWSFLWVMMWCFIVITLLPLAFFLTFTAWSALTLVLFGIPELIGTLKRDAYPPLTHVLVRYVPRWVTLTGISALAAGIGAVWFGIGGVALPLAALFGLYGWLFDHFTSHYDRHDPY